MPQLDSLYRVLAATLTFFPVAVGAMPSSSQLLGRVDLGPGQFREFPLALDVGQTVSIEVESQNLDLQIRLMSPMGDLAAETLVPLWRWRATRLMAAIHEPGTYTVRVDALTDVQFGEYCQCDEAKSRSTVAGEVRLTYSVTPSERWDVQAASAYQLLRSGVKLGECNETRKSEEALKILEEALEEWGEVPSLESNQRQITGFAETLHWRGLVLTDLDQFKEAEAHLRKAIALRAQFAAPGPYADSSYRLGVVLQKQNRNWEALGTLEETLQSIKSREERDELKAVLFAYIGFVHRKLHQLPEALDHYQAALRLYRELGWEKDETSTLKNLGVAYQTLVGDVERARDYFDEALKRARGHGDAETEAAILNDIGWGLKLRGKHRKAVLLFEQAEKKTSRKRRRARFRDNRCRAHLELGELEVALRLCEEARDWSDKQDMAIRSVSLGMIHRRRFEEGEDKAQMEAQAYLQKALRGARSDRDRRTWVAALFELAQLARSEGDLGLALRKTEEALDLVESVRTQVVSPFLRAKFLALQRPIYELRVELLMDQGREASAFSAHERARARTALETIVVQDRGDLNRVEASLLDEERTLLTELDGLDLDQQLGVGVHNELRDRRRELERVQIAIQKERGISDLQSLSGLRDLAAIQQLLDENTLLLEYALGAKRSFLFAMTRDDLDVYILPSSSRIEALALETHRLLADIGAWSTYPHDHHQRAFEAQARVLSKLLLEPVADRLAGRRLAIVPEGALQYVPFSVLPTPGHDSGYKPLAFGHEIVNLPSASVLAALRERPKRSSSKTLVILADPVFSIDDDRVTQRGTYPVRSPTSPSALHPEGLKLNRLKASGREAWAIAQFVEEAQRRVLTGFLSSKQVATGGELAHYRIVHFATHGYINERVPGLSGLALSFIDQQGSRQEGFLRLHDVRNLKLSADLVVLSGCRTALGHEVRGEGLLGLSHGFLSAGAARIVASLWQVDDRATEAFMKHFYRAMFVEDLAPAAALRRARVSLLGEKRGRWRSPHYWAAFVLQGDWRALENPLR